MSLKNKYKEGCNDQDLLNFAIQNGIINMDDVRDSMREKEKQRLLAKHKYSIFQDAKDGRWKTTLPDDTKKSGRRLIARTTKELLMADVLKYYADKEDEEYIKEYGETTLRKLYPRWLMSKFNHTDAAAYIKRINTDWKAFYENDEIADIPIPELTSTYLDEWIHKKIKKHKMTRTKYYNMSIIIRQCLEYACQDGVDIIETNPFEKVKVNKKLLIKKPKPKRETQVYLTKEQKILSQECSARFNLKKNYTTSLMILLNFQLGLRIGELVALKWSDKEGNYLNISRMEVQDYKFVEEEGKVITIPNGYRIVDYTKSDAGMRAVYMNSEARRLFELIREVNEKNGYKDGDFVFVSSQKKTRGNARTITTYLEKLCVVTGIINKSNHKIRKTYISSLFDKGINIDTIRAQAGHEDERTSLNNYCFDQSDLEILEAQLENAKNTTTTYSCVAN